MRIEDLDISNRTKTLLLREGYVELDDLRSDIYDGIVQNIPGITESRYLEIKRISEYVYENEIVEIFHNSDITIDMNFDYLPPYEEVGRYNNIVYFSFHFRFIQPIKCLFRVFRGRKDRETDYFSKSFDRIEFWHESASYEFEYKGRIAFSCVVEIYNEEGNLLGYSDKVHFRGNTEEGWLRIESISDYKNDGEKKQDIDVNIECNPLKDILSENKDIIHNDRSFKALLMDYYPEDKIKRNLIFACLEEDIPGDILNKKKLNQDDINKLSKKLINSYGCKASLAKEIIAIWVDALNAVVVNSDQRDRSKTDTNSKQAGRDKCDVLRKIRKKIADANGIDFIPAECDHEGPCLGTCPVCDKELKYLDEELQKKKARGEKIVLAGIASDEIKQSGCNIDPEVEYNEVPVDGSLYVDDEITMGNVSVPDDCIW